MLTELLFSMNSKFTELAQHFHILIVRAVIHNMGIDKDSGMLGATASIYEVAKQLSLSVHIECQFL